MVPGIEDARRRQASSEREGRVRPRPSRRALLDLCLSEGPRAGRSALGGRAGQNALADPIAADRVRLRGTRIEVLGEVAAVPDHAVVLTVQVPLDLVEDDLDC